MKLKFIRADTFRHSRLGKNRPKLLKWRRPRGKHNKLRLKRTGHPVQPGIGFGTNKKEYGKISGLSPVLVHNLHELEKADKSSIIIIANVGAKKKMEIIKKVQEKGLKIYNLRSKNEA
ncbi:MAG: eL32 family ribosomal protein [Nanoarchaeota archaeon]